MEIIILVAVAGSILTNFLLARELTSAMEELPAPVVNVLVPDVDYNALASAMESSWPTVHINNELEIDYDRLAEALRAQQPTVIYPPAPLPVQIPSYPVYPQYPIISSTEGPEQETMTAANGVEVPIRKF